MTAIDAGKMLQAPSHFSRVCGHGHIKKFWLMQTQKESQACESKSNVSFSPPSRPANRGFVKGMETSPRSSTSPLSGDAAGAPSKHATFTCAESLSLSPQFCKASPTLSSALGFSGAKYEKERFNGRDDCLDSFSMAVGVSARSSISSPCPQPFNAASKQISHRFTKPLTDANCVEPFSVQTNGSSKEHSSSSTQDSPDSHSSRFSRGIQGISAYCPSKSGSNQAVKLEDRSSPFSDSRYLSPLSSHARFPTPGSIYDTAKKGSSKGPLVSRMQGIGHDCLNQAAFIQHAVLKACSLCGTTKTPMWRSGPQGPKSLCNACGIRYKKYRSFPGQDAPELTSPSQLGPVAPKPLSRPLKRKQNSLLPSSDSPRSQKMCFKPSISDIAPHQELKRSRWHQLITERDHSELKDLNRDRCSPWFTRAGPPSLKKIYGCSPFQPKFKKLAPMDEHLSVNGVFAKDEEEAAVLLMHLSCGLVY